MRDVDVDMQIDGGDTPKAAWEIVRDLEQGQLCLLTLCQ
jgi:hypothetical protein